MMGESPTRPKRLLVRPPVEVAAARLPFESSATAPTVPTVPDDLSSRLTAPTSVTRCNASGNVDAVIFQDSFGTALSPILAESFRSTTSFHTTGGPNEKAGYGMPERLKANLVVEILVERSLAAGPAL